MITGIIAHNKSMSPSIRYYAPSQDQLIALTQFLKKLYSQSLFQLTRHGQPRPYYPAQTLLPQGSDDIPIYPALPSVHQFSPMPNQ
eukprot:scaffold5855_cov157-Skeletonema_menzelii.AAC.1